MRAVSIFELAKRNGREWTLRYTYDIWPMSAALDNASEAEETAFWRTANNMRCVRT